jgi:hypothetical protein
VMRSWAQIRSSDTSLLWLPTHYTIVKALGKQLRYVVQQTGKDGLPLHAEVTPDGVRLYKGMKVRAK